MGFLSNLTSGAAKSGDALSGGHRLNTGSLLGPTDRNAINPTNPGNLTNIRSNEVIAAPRVFTRKEADELCLREALASNVLANTKRAFRALGRQENNDAELQSTYRQYQGRVATAELKKVKANAALGKTLHAMRGAYAALGFGTQMAEVNANQRVAEIKARIAGMR